MKSVTTGQIPGSTTSKTDKQSHQLTFKQLVLLTFDYGADVIPNICISSRLVSSIWVSAFL